MSCQGSEDGASLVTLEAASLTDRGDDGCALAAELVEESSIRYWKPLTTARCFDPIEDWRTVALDVRGRSMPTGHYIAEEAPEETLREFAAFFGQEGP